MSGHDIIDFKVDRSAVWKQLVSEFKKAVGTHTVVSCRDDTVWCDIFKLSLRGDYAQVVEMDSGSWGEACGETDATYLFPRTREFVRQLTYTYLGCKDREDTWAKQDAQNKSDDLASRQIKAMEFPERMSCAEMIAIMKIMRERIRVLELKSRYTRKIINSVDRDSDWPEADSSDSDADFNSRSLVVLGKHFLAHSDDDDNDDKKSDATNTASSTATAAPMP